MHIRLNVHAGKCTCLPAPTRYAGCYGVSFQLSPAQATNIHAQGEGSSVMGPDVVGEHALMVLSNMANAAVLDREAVLTWGERRRITSIPCADLPNAAPACCNVTAH